MRYVLCLDLLHGTHQGQARAGLAFVYCACLSCVTKLVLDLGDEHFPFHSSKECVVIDSVHMTCAVDEHAAPSLTLTVSVGEKTREYPLAAGTGPEGLRSLEKKFDSELGEVVISGKPEDVARITEVVLLCSYTFQSKTTSP
jgi:hypothetical protein